MDHSTSPWQRGFKPGDRVRIVEGTFAHKAGEVLTHEDAQRRRLEAGQPRCRPAPTGIRVLIDLFGLPVPVEFQPQQIEHAP